LAKKTGKEIDKRIKDIRWLQWQIIRRKPEYRSDVEQLITAAKNKAGARSRLPSTPLHQLTSKEHQNIIKQWNRREAYARIVEVYNLASYLYKDFVDKGITILCNGKDHKYCHGCTDKGKIEYRVKEEIFECLRMKPLPKRIIEFKKKWHIKFPVDPDIKTFTDWQLFRNYESNN